MVGVLALAGRLDSATFRYRVGQFIEPLKSLGVAVEARALPRRRGRRKGVLSEVAGFDVVWLLRQALAGLEMRELRQRARRLVFDLDDAVWMRDSHRLVRFSTKRRFRFGRAARCADLILAGNDFLADQVGRFNTAVQVMPTCVEVQRYCPRPEHDPRDVLDLVWIGQASTLGYLGGILSALEAFAVRRPARLRVIADAFPRSRRIEIVPVRWSSETEAQELAAADIGLAPLTDDEWAQGKCGLKVLQYMAAGLPVVASPVGVQVAMIGRNERGRLAASPDEWVAHLTALADDPTERRRCGRAGRVFVERHYSASDWAPRLAQALRAVAAREGPAG
jgi:glycosyltransferase involved in cell wall biosynthesis